MAQSEHKRLCSTKVSREKLAAQIEALATECGAQCTRRETYLQRKRQIGLLLTVGMWRCMLDLDAGCDSGAFLGHWYHDGDGQETLPKHFDLTIRGSENPYHRRKATSCQERFADFLDSLRAGLTALHAAD